MSLLRMKSELDKMQGELQNSVPFFSTRYKVGYQRSRRFVLTSVFDYTFDYYLTIYSCLTFARPNHSKQHMAIGGLSLHLGSSESSKTLEQNFIFQIGTLNPIGINERFSLY